MVHMFNPSAWEAEAVVSSTTWSHCRKPELHSENKEEKRKIIIAIFFLYFLSFYNDHVTVNKPRKKDPLGAAS